MPGVLAVPAFVHVFVLFLFCFRLVSPSLSVRAFIHVFVLFHSNFVSYSVSAFIHISVFGSAFGLVSVSSVSLSTFVFVFVCLTLCLFLFRCLSLVSFQCIYVLFLSNSNSLFPFCL